MPLALYLTGAAIGLSVALEGSRATVRFFGVLAALATFFLLLDAVGSARAAGRVVGGALLAALLLAPLLLIMALPHLQLERLPPSLSGYLAELSTMTSIVQHAVPDDAVTRQRNRLTGSGLGTFLACAVGLAFGLVLDRVGHRIRVLAGLAMVGFVCLFPLSARRSAVLSTLVVVLVLLVARLLAAPGKGRALRPAFGVLLAVVLAGTLVWLARPEWPRTLEHALGHLPLAARDSGPMYVRLEYWQNLLFLLEDFRFTGVGLGQSTVRQMYRLYFLTGESLNVEGISIQSGNFRFAHAHDIRFQTYLEQGLPGLAGLLGAIFLALAIGWRTVVRSHEPTVRAAALSAGGVVLALVLTGTLVIAPVTNVGEVLLFGAFGLMAAAGRLADAPLGARRPEPAPASRPFFAGRGRLAAAALLAMAVLLAGWLGREPQRMLVVPASVDRWPDRVAATLYLNLGTLEVTRAKVDRRQSGPEQEQRLAAADALLGRAREYDPSNLGTLRGLAAVALARARDSEALDILAEVEARADPDDDRTLFQLGRLYREAGAVDRAIAAWSRVDPSIGAWSGASPQTHFILWAAQLAASEQWEAAAAVSRAAIALESTAPAPYRVLARAVARSHGQDAAMRELWALTEARADVPWAHEEVGRLCEEAGRVAEAEVWRARALRVHTEHRWPTRAS